jgi:hypothetical protein
VPRPPEMVFRVYFRTMAQKELDWIAEAKSTGGGAFRAERGKVLESRIPAVQGSGAPQTGTGPWDTC